MAWLHRFSIPLVIGSCVLAFVVLWTLCYWWLRRDTLYAYFDAQDFAEFEKGGGHKLPLSSKTGTFALLLQHYIDLTKLLITVAAASIAFAGNQSASDGIRAAKLVLAFSVLYGVSFCTLLLYFYDEYGYDVTFYTRSRYSTVQAFGFSCLVCFIAGYVMWAFSLG